MASRALEQLIETLRMIEQPVESMRADTFVVVLRFVTGTNTTARRTRLANSYFVAHTILSMTEWDAVVFDDGKPSIRIEVGYKDEADELFEAFKK